MINGRPGGFIALTGLSATALEFKSGIESMGASTARLAQLRPVTCRLRTDEHGTVPYGRIDGVRYDQPQRNMRAAIMTGTGADR